MHWSDPIADEIIKRHPDKEEYVCAAGISPSGSVHIGNFRDVATSYNVVLALRNKGKKAKLLFSWDDFDRLRKVPVNVAKIAPDFDQYIGKPYVDCPDPFGCCASYAAHFEKEFERSVSAFGIQMDFRHQAEMYRSGKYKDNVLEALAKRGEIYDLLEALKAKYGAKNVESTSGHQAEVKDTRAKTEKTRDSYYPVAIYCPVCGKDDTKITAYDDATHRAEYICACGHSDTFDFETNFNCKLAWKADWAMRWKYEQVDFEPGGKDHATVGGSYTASSALSKQVFGYTAPYFQGYEFIGIKGSTGKMSGSSGLAMTPEVLLKLYQPEVILWLYSKTAPLHAFDFCFDDGILRQYFEFDRQLNAVRNGTADEYVSDIMAHAAVPGHEVKTVPMSQLVSLGSIVDFNPPMIETIFEKIGTPYKYADFAERLDLAKCWAETCSPESLNHLLPNRNWEKYETLSPEEQQEITLLHAYLANHDYDLDQLNTELYAIPGKVRELADDKARKAAQGRFFKNAYQLLIGKEKGPRLYLFLFAIDKAAYLPLLDFSTPKTEAELALAEPDVSVSATEPVSSVKPEITLDDFGKLDLRVCRVLNAEEMKKTRAMMKLTLDDGLGGRTIMSSIKGIYTPEQLIGKKIIVIANLKPAKLSGVMSEGMLLAVSYGDHECKILFADDEAPIGCTIG